MSPRTRPAPCTLRCLQFLRGRSPPLIPPLIRFPFFCPSPPSCRSAYAVLTSMPCFSAQSRTSMSCFSTLCDVVSALR